MLEIIIVMGLSVVLLSGLIEIVLAHQQTNRLQKNLSKIQANGRYAVDYLRMDLRRAGYAGCLPGGLSAASSQLSTAITADYQSALITDASYEKDFNSSNPGTNSDSLKVVSGLGAGAAVASTMAAQTDAVEVFASHLIKKNSIVVISNCEDGDLFYVTKITDTSGAGDFDDCASAGSTCLLEHAAGTNNISPALSKLYATDARVFPVQSRLYSIAVQTGEENSLQVSDDGKLVEGVENMQVFYGEDGADVDQVADYYVPLDDVVDMDQVVSLKINLLMRSGDDNLADQPTVYDFAGNTNIVSPDKRLRKVFNTTIALRNKLQ